MSGKCETCRWWERKWPTESEKKVVERFYAGERCDAIYTMVGPDLAERMVYAAKFNVEVGEGYCHGMPMILKKQGKDWCGQWKEMG